MLEEIPDVTYDDIGGLGDQIGILRDSVELPYIYPEVFAEHKLSPPKGILLYGPPGCGKTLIAKAVANSLAKSIEKRTGKETTPYFLNVKGPELLNKYVGETEHKLREVFKKARDKASENVPVVIFFDEMDSLFRMRGSGISSDMEATVVAQFLSEIDGVESLNNVIVIGASNRQDLIDPAVLRPGRLDLKIKVNRPDAKAAREIFAKYLTADLPFHQSTQEHYGSDPAKIVEGMISRHDRSHVHDQRGKQVPRGHLREGRARDLLLQGLRQRRDDPEHRVARQEARSEAHDRAERARHHARRPDQLRERRVQGERGSPEHHQPRRLGADLGPQGRAHHQRAHADDRHLPQGEVD